MESWDAAAVAGAQAGGCWRYMSSSINKSAECCQQCRDARARASPGDAEGSWHQPEPFLPPVGIGSRESSSCSWHRPLQHSPVLPAPRAAPWNWIEGPDTARKAHLDLTRGGEGFGGKQGERGACGCSVLSTPQSRPPLSQQRDGRRIKWN